MLAGRRGADVLLGPGVRRRGQVGGVGDGVVAQHLGAEADHAAQLAAGAVEDVGELEQLGVLVGALRHPDGHATSASTGASSAARSSGMTRATSRRRPVLVAPGAQGPPAVGHQGPGEHADRAGLLARHVGDQRPQPAAGLGGQSGQRGHRLGVGELAAGAVGDRAGVVVHQHRDQVGAVGPGGLDRGVGQLVREVDPVGHDRVVQRQVLGHDGDPGQLGSPRPGREPRELEDQPVLCRQRRDRAAVLPVPRLHLHRTRGHVDVDGDGRGGQQPDRAEEAVVDDTVSGAADQQPAPGQRGGGVVQPCERVGVRRLLVRAAAATEPVVESAVAGLGLAEVEGERGAVRALGDEPELRQGQRHPSRQPVEQVVRGRARRPEVDGRHVRSGPGPGRRPGHPHREG